MIISNYQEETQESPGRGAVRHVLATPFDTWRKIPQSGFYCFVSRTREVASKMSSLAARNVISFDVTGFLVETTPTSAILILQ